MTPIMQYRRDTRRPAIWIGAGTCALLAAYGLQQGNPWWSWATWLAPLAIFLLILTRRDVSGVWLDHDALVLSPEGEARRLPFDGIDEVELADHHESLTVTIWLHDGRMERLIADLAPPLDVLVPVLKGAGLQVRAG
ncbi:MAG: DNA helicase IV / RNA helicase N terminal [Rhodobacteraceae bacterium HLUCCA08]|nr:MAG: DNA helicase IV / RNA helicase N terminal [Rhodobacteraceae bacterium HLUCCA08]